jgi:hypothetical protein
LTSHHYLSICRNTLGGYELLRLQLHPPCL